MTTRYQIAEHWKAAQSAVIPATATKWFVFSLEEPCCFACGYHEEEWWYGPEGKVARWNQSRLHRAHIVGKSIGGADSPANYLLLCVRCHRQAPMTNDPAILLTWAWNRDDHLAHHHREFVRELSKYDIPANLDMSGWTQFLEDIQVDNHPHSTGSGRPDTAARDAVLLYAYSRRVKNS